MGWAFPRSTGTPGYTINGFYRGILGDRLSGSGLNGRLIKRLVIVVDSTTRKGFDKKSLGFKNLKGAFSFSLRGSGREKLKENKGRKKHPSQLVGVAGCG
jgi:hypothetical protein